MVARFRILAAGPSAWPEAAAVILSAQGHEVGWQDRSGPKAAALCAPGQGWIRDPLRALNIACGSGVPPGRGGILPRLVMALDLLAAIDPAAFPAALDLQIFAFRQAMHRIAAVDPAAFVPPEACLLAVLIWQAGRVDAQSGLFLRSGFATLSDRVQPVLDDPCHAALLARLSPRLDRRRPQAPGVDWSRALGPAGQEKTLLPRVQKSKIHSIGSTSALR